MTDGILRACHERGGTGELGSGREKIKRKAEILIHGQAKRRIRSRQQHQDPNDHQRSIQVEVHGHRHNEGRHLKSYTRKVDKKELFDNRW